VSMHGAGSPPETPAALRVVPAPQRGAWITAGVVVAVVGAFLYVVVTGEGVQWAEIPRYLLDPTILAGVRLTLLFTVLAMALGVSGGLVLELLRRSRNPILTSLAGAYVWFFRGTPLLVQIIFWFNIQLFIPKIAIGSFAVETNRLVSPFTAALLALSLNEAAYLAEIVRAGLLSVDKGQTEAALALGLTPLQTLRRIVVPQALRFVIPPVVSVVAAQDLLTRAQNIYARNFLVIELLFVASIWYLVLTTLASLVQHWIERRLSREMEDRGWPPRRWTRRALVANLGDAR
jgi:polar amino acid transport system permease protein